MLNIDLGNKRPDCQGCGAKESATMLVHGLLLCGGCIMKITEKNANEEAERVSRLKSFLGGD